MTKNKDTLGDQCATPTTHGHGYLDPDAHRHLDPDALGGVTDDKTDSDGNPTGLAPCADSLNLAALRQFAELTVLKRYLDSRVDDVKARLAKLDPIVLEEFSRCGVGTIPIDVAVHDEHACGYEGRVTLYTKVRRWSAPADGKTKDDIGEWLREHEPSMVKETYNANTFNAFVNREADGDEGLPASLAALIVTNETPKTVGRVDGAAETL